MEHLPFSSTPIDQLNHFSRKYNAKIICKRDDLFYMGGGSKARMLRYIIYPLYNNNINTLLTPGGPCSNYNRAAALMCVELGIKMRLVSYTDEPSEYDSLNHFLVQLAGAELIPTSKDKVPQTIQKEIDRLKEEEVPFQYCYGGGKSIEGIYAYYEAVKELHAQYPDSIDEVYVACGTGTTLTGICCGMQAFFPKAKVHGISVARDFISESPVLKEDLQCLNDYLKTSYDLSNLVFHDEFLLGGYGKTSPEALALIQESISQEGLLVDPTYSGKALYGMTKCLSASAPTRKTILFWHTGGIMNLLSQRRLFKL